MSEVQQVYERVTAMLQAEHRLTWAVGAQPTPAGLLDCLTGDACWEVLCAYRQGECGAVAEVWGGRMHACMSSCAHTPTCPPAHPPLVQHAKRRVVPGFWLPATPPPCSPRSVDRSVGGAGGQSAARPECARSVLTCTCSRCWSVGVCAAGHSVGAAAGGVGDVCGGAADDCPGGHQDRWVGVGDGVRVGGAVLWRVHNSHNPQCGSTATSPPPLHADAARTGRETPLSRFQAESFQRDKQLVLEQRERAAAIVLQPPPARHRQVTEDDDGGVVASRGCGCFGF